MLNLTPEESRRASDLQCHSIVIDSLGPAGPTILNEVTAAKLEKSAASGASLPSLVHEYFQLTEQALLAGHLDDYWRGWNESGVDVSSCTVGALGFDSASFSYENAVAEIAVLTRRFDNFNQLVKVTKAADVERVHQEGKHGLILNFQNTTHFGEDLDALNRFYAFGIRQIQLTYNSRNYVGDGCSERNPSGLSNFGIRVVRELNELGILIDVSHCSAQTTLDAVKFSKRPIAVTHAASAALQPHDRNKSDDVIKAVGEGGYFGVLPGPPMLTSDGVATLEHWLRHLEHVLDLIGIDHVGVCTDLTIRELFRLLLNSSPDKNALTERFARLSRSFGMREEHNVQMGVTVEGLESWRYWPNLTSTLVLAGYSDEQIKKLVGGNFLSVFGQAVG